MAIQPIDLQTMYTQLDTVAKAVTHQQQGAQLSHAMHAAEINRQETEKNTAVQELTPENNELSTVHDRNSSGKQEDEQKKQQRKAKERELIGESIKDPNLGIYIDVLG